MFPPGLVYACYSHLLLIPPGDSAPALPQSPFHSTPQSSLPANPVLTRPLGSMPYLTCQSHPIGDFRVRSTSFRACLADRFHSDPIRAPLILPCPSTHFQCATRRPLLPVQAFLTLPFRVAPRHSCQTKQGESCPSARKHACLNSSNS